VPRHSLKPAIKRGALLAAANWPVTLIQASADSLFKLLLAAPIIGGVFLVALAVGSEPYALMSLESRELVATIASALMSQPLVLTAYLLALAVVAVGGSLFVFLVKGGTVATLVRSDREAGAIEEPPLHVSTVARASRFGVDEYVESAWMLFPRYARLGVVLMAAYVVSGLSLTVMFVFALVWQFSRGSWLNYGVDFSGGTLVQVAFSQPTTVAQSVAASAITASSPSDTPTVRGTGSASVTASQTRYGTSP